eukprot:CAMPEP_0194074890 /NCGR_PEP_ID=MMETSP0149-20130528/1939_1 /TAXON_ID=122233 /ORGANISM="Chaetoceros debilis, Strain MM31A-1" /LENGTH=654 /DNA_ID=CAMNT_0038755191 /DNA_START=22 /DNA_END=1982 /DNA_ORIENTATION=-
MGRKKRPKLEQDGAAVDQQQQQQQQLQLQLQQQQYEAGAAVQVPVPVPVLVPAALSVPPPSLAPPLRQDPRKRNSGSFSGGNSTGSNFPDSALCAPINPMGSMPPVRPITLSPIPVPPPKVQVGTMEVKKEMMTSVDRDGYANKNKDASIAASNKGLGEEESTKEKQKSGYAMTSHSADLITEDIYLSDGSEDEDEINTNINSGADGESPGGLELMLTASKMGLMRRGLHSQMFQQTKTWVRPTEEELKAKKKEGGDNDSDGGKDGDGDGAKEVSSDEADADAKEDEKLANMEPAQRAAYLQVEKQRKLEEVANLKRKIESSENAGRDPCLFSKRTAFDIRMDQIEEKPWDRAFGGTADMTDYFNYGMGEEDWLEYSERQLSVRQELTDASRQRRNPDPTIVPVQPKTPSVQNPRVAVITKKQDDDGDVDMEESEEAPDVEMELEVGPVLPAAVKKEDDDVKVVGAATPYEESKLKKDSKPDITNNANSNNLGGAWAAPPGSKLAKLIEEQENNKNKPPPPPMGMGGMGGHMNMPPDNPYGGHGSPPRNDKYHHQGSDGGDGGGGGGYNNHDNNFNEHHQGAPTPPRGPPPPYQGNYQQYGGGGGGGRGFPPPPPVHHDRGHYGGGGGRGGGSHYGGRGDGGGGSHYGGRGDGG